MPVSLRTWISKSPHLYQTFRANFIAPVCHFLPAALRAAQTCRYLVYSEADFEVFRPAGATRCTDGGEIWHGGGDQRSPHGPLLHAKFHPHLCNGKGVGPQKLKILLRFDRNLAPQGRIPCVIFTKFAEFVPHFRMRWVLKFGWICSRGYGGFKLRGSGFPQIFSAP